MKLYLDKQFQYDCILKAVLSIQSYCTARPSEISSGKYVSNDGKEYRLYPPTRDWKEQIISLINSDKQDIFKTFQGLNILAGALYIPSYVKDLLKEAWRSKNIKFLQEVLQQKREQKLFSLLLRKDIVDVKSTIGLINRELNKLGFEDYNFSEDREIIKLEMKGLYDNMKVFISDKKEKAIVKAFKARDAEAFSKEIRECYSHPDFTKNSIDELLKTALDTIKNAWDYVDCSSVRGSLFGKPKAQVLTEYVSHIHARVYPPRLEYFQARKQADGKLDNRVFDHETGDYKDSYFTVQYAPKLRLHNAVGAPRGSRYSLTKDTIEPKDVFTVSVDRPEVLDEYGRPIECTFTDSYTGEVVFYYTKKEGKAKYYTFRVIKEGKNTFYEYYLSSYQGEEILVGGKSTVKKISHDNIVTLLELLGVEDISRMSTYRLCKTYITYVEFIKKHQDFLTGALELAPSVHWARAYEMLLVLDLIRIRSIARQFLRIYKEELIQFKREFGLNFSGLKPLEALELAYRVYANSSTSSSLVETYGDITYFEDVIHKKQ